MTTPAQILNDLFLKKTDKDMEGARSLLSSFIEGNLKKFSKAPELVRVEFNKMANVVTLSLLGIQDGKEVSGTKSWTEMELLSDDRPVTMIFMDLVTDVFGSPGDQLCS